MEGSTPSALGWCDYFESLERDEFYVAVCEFYVMSSASASYLVDPASGICLSQGLSHASAKYE